MCNPCCTCSEYALKQPQPLKRGLLAMSEVQLAALSECSNIGITRKGVKIKAVFLGLCHATACTI